MTGPIIPGLGLNDIRHMGEDELGALTQQMRALEQTPPVDNPNLGAMFAPPQAAQPALATQPVNPGAVVRQGGEPNPVMEAALAEKQRQREAARQARIKEASQTNPLARDGGGGARESVRVEQTLPVEQASTEMPDDSEEGFLNGMYEKVTGDRDLMMAGLIVLSGALRRPEYGQNDMSLFADGLQAAVQFYSGRLDAKGKTKQAELDRAARDKSDKMKLAASLASGSSSKSLTQAELDSQIMGLAGKLEEVGWENMNAKERQMLRGYLSTQKLDLVGKAAESGVASLIRTSIEEYEKEADIKTLDEQGQMEAIRNIGNSPYGAYVTRKENSKGDVKYTVPTDISERKQAALRDALKKAEEGSTQDYERAMKFLKMYHEKKQR